MTIKVYFNPNIGQTSIQIAQGLHQLHQNHYVLTKQHDEWIEVTMTMEEYLQYDKNNLKNDSR